MCLYCLQYIATDKDVARKIYFMDICGWSHRHIGLQIIVLLFTDLLFLNLT